MMNWAEKIVSIKNESEFNTLTIEAFSLQYENNSTYKAYCQKLNKHPENVKIINEIPFLPIEFFKTHNIIANNKKQQITFTSSGTTGAQTSRHHVIDLAIYERSFISAFSHFYGAIEDYCILALLPSYIERGGSSLVYMANKLIELSMHADSGFYLNNYKQLFEKLEAINKTNKKVLLLGVTYALLDLAEQYPIALQNAIIMETGGMKGHRKELVREELHSILCMAFGVTTIHSEYGMTELLSQAYSKGNGIFETPGWMKIRIRDTYDPFTFLSENRSGGINVIDLANINSCCFIETKDIGKVFSDKTFTVLGRFDQSDIRGCNLLVG